VGFSGSGSAGGADFENDDDPLKLKGHLIASSPELVDCRNVEDSLSN